MLKRALSRKRKMVSPLVYHPGETSVAHSLTEM
jgi:hypothetical protein